MTGATIIPEAAARPRVRRAGSRLLFPPGQPLWARPALLAVAAMATALYAWDIADAGYAPFYSMAVRSMSQSWKALLYGAVDPRASLTIDKLAGSFVPQALSARLFGFHQWSLALPQVVEGTVSVLVIYRVVRRWIGGDAAQDRTTEASAAGLLAAGILAFTPVVAAMFEHTMEDGALTMCLVLAVDRYQYAVAHGRLRSLIASGVWVGLGFQAKMIEAWMILPALAAGYLLTAPSPLRRRVLDTVTAGVVTVAVSLSWVLLLTFTPGSDRPYVDGSTNDNAFAMVFGYNGLGRLGIHIPGAVPAENTAYVQDFLHRLGVPSSVAQSLSGNGGTGWTKLFGEHLGPQVGWLFPLALITLLAGLWAYRRRPRTDTLRGGFILWGAWLVVVAVVYSAMTIPHTAYLSILAVPIAALSAAGIVLFGRTRLLSVLVVAETAWMVYLARDYGSFLPWLEPTVIALAAVAVVGTEVVPRLVPRLRVAVVASLLGVAAMLATPVAWAACTLDAGYRGTSLDAAAGPPQGVLAGGGALASALRRGLNQYASMTPAQQRLFGYVEAHLAPGSTYAFATDSWLTAQPYIAETGAPVLPMGGFSGQVPFPTPDQVRAWVHDGRLTYFVLDRPGSISTSLLFGDSAGPSLAAIDSWVRTSCAVVPPSAYGTAPAAAAATVLYACHP